MSARVSALRVGVVGAADDAVVEDADDGEEVRA